MKRNKFSLSHFKLQSTMMGVLAPLTWYEVLPGDSIQHMTSMLVRCAPLVTPPMHPCHVRVHCFFVPNRIIWQGSNPTGSEATGGFENFITGGPTGNDTTVHPYLTVLADNAVGSLFDYLGLATRGRGAQIYNVNALPVRAYQLIWNEWFRDRDLQTAAVVSTADGLDTTTSLTVQNVCWEKDYLTTTRATESKGPSVSIFQPGAVANLQAQTAGTALTHVGYTGWAAQSANTTVQNAALYDATTDAVVAGSNVSVNLGSNTAGMDINTLRMQFGVQRYQEARLRFGSRYSEMLRYYGVRCSDGRLQRPELLSSSRTTLQFSEVLNTTSTNSATMYGHGIAGHRGYRFRRFFEEHGIVMCLFSARPITMYSNAVNRRWLRGMTGANGATAAPAGMLGNKWDYFTPELQYIGQQQTNGCEVDMSVGMGNTFGWQDRYDEYRGQESQVTGQFRVTLDSWHFSREFASAPALNSTFVSCVPRTTPFADTTDDNLYIMSNHSIQARRMIGKRGESFAR